MYCNHAGRPSPESTHLASVEHLLFRSCCRGHMHAACPFPTGARRVRERLTKPMGGWQLSVEQEASPRRFVARVLAFWSPVCCDRRLTSTHSLASHDEEMELVLAEDAPGLPTASPGIAGLGQWSDDSRANRSAPAQLCGQNHCRSVE